MRRYERRIAVAPRRLVRGWRSRPRPSLFIATGMNQSGVASEAIRVESRAAKRPMVPRFAGDDTRPPVIEG